ncbi:MAG: preprotein translocase subunit YajC [Gemmatimonadota bacterium]
MMTMFALQAEGAPVGQSPMVTILLFAGLFAIFYFLLIRPQKKQQEAHQEMVEALKRGDEVVTVGGIVGKIIHLTDDRVTVKTADDTRIEVARSKVGQLLSGGK